MTVTNITSGETHSGIVSTTLATIDVVTFTGRHVDVVEVVNVAGAADLWFTIDGTTPTVGGRNCHRVPAVAEASRRAETPASAGTLVKLTAATPTSYIVATLEPGR